MDQQELAERIAELPREKRALLFEQLQKQKQREVLRRSVHAMNVVEQALVRGPEQRQKKEADEPRYRFRQ